MLLKIMLDTMIYDYLVTKPNGPELVEKLHNLISQGKVEIITTHIQEDEIALTPDADLLAQIYAVMNQMPRRLVQANDNLVGAIISEEGNHTRDALIGGTAHQEADVLVTDDKRLTRRLQSIGVRCDIWTFDQFHDHLIHPHK